MLRIARDLLGGGFNASGRNANDTVKTIDHAGRRSSVRPRPNREKALQILSKSIYKELRENGYEPKQIVALATEIISLVTTSDDARSSD